MANAKKKGFTSDFRTFFIRGLATLLPTILTIVVLVKCFEFIQTHISVHMTQGIAWLTVKVTNNYPKLTEENQLKYYDLLEITLSKEERERYRLNLGLANEAEQLLEVRAELRESNNLRIQQEKMQEPEVQDAIRLAKMTEEWAHGPRSLVGFGLAIILVYIVGRLLASFLGRKLWKLFERAVARIPGFNQIYPHVKQVTEFLFGEKKIEFNRVVAAPYPRKGIWSLGLVTGAGFRKISETAREEFLTVFIPSSPIPGTGYVITVKKDEVIDVPISIEEALRFTISGGVIVPDRQRLPQQKLEVHPGPTLEKEKYVEPSNLSDPKL